MTEMKPRRGADHTTMREVNRSLVLDLVKAGGRVSRASIARSTTLAKPTVSAIVDELIADGLIEEVGVGTTSGGRPPILLRFNAGSQLVVGVHVGARRTTVAAGDATGMELVRKELATPRGEPAEVLRIVAATVRNVLEIGQLGPTPISAVGVVVPGLTDFHTGVCMLAPNLGWRDVPVSQLLSEELACPVYVHNAGQAAAVAEHIEGAGVGVEDLALLYAGTGLSAGVISSGRVLHGAGGTAGEIGHCAVPGLQEHCACGKTGCLETVASGRGLITAVRRAVEAGRPTVLAGQRDLDGRDIADAAQRGDVLAREAIADLGRYLGYATSWLINAYSPAMVVVGGGLAAIGEPLLDLVRQAAVRHCPAPALRGVEILGSQLGVDVELRGAVLLAMQHSETYYRVVFRA